MLRRLLASTFAMVAFALPVNAPAASTSYHHKVATHTTSTSDSTLHEYDTEAAAQVHCPSDTVVWLNTNSGIWHEKGMRWYGRTKHGAYVCRNEAAAAGDRDTMNGQ